MLRHKILFSVLILLSVVTPSFARVYSGMEVFRAKYTSLVKGKRVGLITNQTGVDAKLNSTVDLFYRDPRINLVALFAPEHGVRGTVPAGKSFKGSTDPKTGLPIYSLYGGGDHKPSKSALAKIDVLIYDIQDVGSRAYTFIWSLAKCMEAARENGKDVIVLDRPDPFGANVVDGGVLEKKFRSFIGLYSIPRVYGMTVGEFSRYLNYEEKIRCRLRVIPMANYKRGMMWWQTGLPWVPTSPYIPNPESAYTFAATGVLGEAGLFNIGIGYTLPFQCVAAPWINADNTAHRLNRLGLPGVVFRAMHFKPTFGRYAKSDINGVQIHVTNPAVFRPATTEIALLSHFRRFYPSYFKWDHKRNKTFDKGMGSSKVREMILAGKSANSILSMWRPGLNAFKQKRQRYLIYK